MYILEFHLMYVHFSSPVVTHTQQSELYLKGSTAPSTYRTLFLCDYASEPAQRESW